MKYNFSNREKMLLKIVVSIISIYLLFSATNYVTKNIQLSKNLLLQKVDNFNQHKQFLAQIKLIKENSNNVFLLADFEELLLSQGINFDVTDNQIVIPGLEAADALQLLDNADQNNLDLESFNLSLQQDGSLELIITTNE
tara:strand:+ start:5138 stop:5557 length:420 start_codon:yes stop_codon:yes gene_type:complete